MEENNNEEAGMGTFLTDMMDDIMKKDPSMAMQVMMAAFKLPVLQRFVEEHKEELDTQLTITMSAGEALFLYAACLQSIASMGNNSNTRADGSLHTHVLRPYQHIGMKFAKMVGDIGYPERSSIADMAGAIASVDATLEHVENISNNVKAGNMTFDDVAGREFR